MEHKKDIAEVTDTSAEMLIQAAVPLLDKLLGMWVVSKSDKRLARAMRDALTSSEGIEIATKIAKYYNPYSAENGTDDKSENKC